jgi:hypothetical protein
LDEVSLHRAASLRRDRFSKPEGPAEYSLRLRSLAPPLRSRRPALRMTSMTISISAGAIP